MTRASTQRSPGRRRIHVPMPDRHDGQEVGKLDPAVPALLEEGDLSRVEEVSQVAATDSEQADCLLGGESLVDFFSSPARASAWTAEVLVRNSSVGSAATELRCRTKPSRASAGCEGDAP